MEFVIKNALLLKCLAVFPVNLFFPRESDWGEGGQFRAQGTQGAGWGSGQAMALKNHSQLPSPHLPGH